MITVNKFFAYWIREIEKKDMKIICNLFQVQPLTFIGIWMLC